MALDPNIILQAGRGVTPLLSPTDIQDQQMKREIGRYQLNALRQTSEDDTAYRNVLRSGVAPDQMPNKLYAAGLGKQAQEAQKFQVDQQKSARDAEKAKYETALKQYEVVGQVLGTVRDQASYDAGRQQLQAMGIPTPNAPPQYDPNVVQQFQQQAMSAKDQVAQKWKAMEYTTPNANAVLGAETARSNSAASIANSQRTADMTDARAREANTLRAQGNAQGRIPSGYRVGGDGQTLEFIPGGPADPTSKAGGGKPLTEGQSKALLFGTRMQEANSILDELASNGVNTSVPGSRAGFGVGAAINALQPADRQRLDQAKRDFLNAVLRRESGAVIADTEFNNGDKQYFPQPGDGEAVIAQKKRNREVAMRGILAEVPDGDSRVSQVRGGGAQPTKPGTPLKRGAAQAAPADLGGIEAELKRRGLLK